MNSDLGLTATETGELAEYRTISRPALFAAAAVLLSPVALIHPLLTFVPWLAAVLAALALITMRSDQIGRTLAACVLVPAIVLGTMGPTRYVSRQQKLFQDARRFGNSWLGFIEDGRIHEAHQLIKTYFERQPAEVSLEEYYANPLLDSNRIPTQAEMNGPFSELMEFRLQNPIAEVLTWQNGFDAQFVKNLRIRRDTTDSESISLLYRLTERGKSDDHSVMLSLVLQRFVQDDTAYWRVFEFGDVDDAALSLRERQMTYQTSK